MTEIGPGTILVCVDDGNDRHEENCSCGKTSGLTKDAIYTCSEAHEADAGRACDCGQDPCMRIHVVGKPYCYCHTLFKPLNDGDTSLVEEERELEDA